MPSPACQNNPGKESFAGLGLVGRTTPEKGINYPVCPDTEKDAPEPEEGRQTITKAVNNRNTIDSACNPDHMENVLNSLDGQNNKNQQHDRYQGHQNTALDCPATIELSNPRKDKGGEESCLDIFLHTSLLQGKLMARITIPDNKLLLNFLILLVFIPV
jgi:hypothetical protein